MVDNTPKRRRGKERNVIRCQKFPAALLPAMMDQVLRSRSVSTEDFKGPIQEFWEERSRLVETWAKIIPELMADIQKFRSET